MKIIEVTPSNSIQAVLNQYSSIEKLIIKLSPGKYHEKLSIDTDYVTIEGHSPKTTFIVNSDYNYKIHQDGQIYNTFRTQTVNILSNDVTLKNLTVRNDAGSKENIGQAIALSVYGNNFQANNCYFHGYQDTIFCGPLPEDLTIRYQNFLPKSHLSTKDISCNFESCIVSGAIDFIFGSAFAIFRNCKIIAIDKGYIVAPSTYKDFEFGFVFIDCEIISQSKSFDVYLARPWRNHGAVCFICCNFKGNFHPERYELWGKDVYRFYESPQKISKYSKELSSSKEEQLRMGGIKKIAPYEKITN